MQIDLSGKTAIVTGSTRGIGFAIAKGLAQAGATVVINGRSAPSVDKAVSLLQQYVPDATLRGVVADVGSVDGCAVLKAAEPEVDILVNNTGIYGPRDFFETGDDIWTEFFEVNVMSGVRLSREYLPGMVSRQWGRVIFISSESALNIPADMIHYGFTKTANLSVARGLAKRMAGTGVTVNSILPGPTLSEGVAEMLKEASERTGQTLEEVAADFVRENRPSSILQRAATTEEVANLVVYTASPLASATTGAALRVDGGVVDTIA
ncbi:MULTISPECIES: SDR family NAD(P)-dependent oxidoreductase [Pseudomonas]|uniref:NAD(P)-dependent dehydrogenase, short-chain alcohol dehydrogenase family n=1 Tax=Pseudomonas lutea TaxID=243924 RepID=A0A9X8MCE6_9PSED|nr:MULTISPECIES: SDR family oxidoreductase [Pseudomonas]MCG7372366.1 SDR family oxidoreductase [Pseudomonas luteola]MDN3234372.1 SDR family oxidoreductase [Pseudomonas sp. WAC2]SEQ43810.1 NAD(P)-dependent dehydrogenase, short-chain alcohol dehydrogenase family [Pseudomonas lutea]